MPVVDFHAHLTPERYRRAVERDGDWHGLAPGKTAWDPGELHHYGFTMPMEERLADLDALGIDIQVISPTPGFFQYDNDLETTTAIARECNDEIAELVAAHPTRFAGIGTLPMQDVGAGVAEMERVIGELGFKGVIVNDHVLGATWDDEQFTPFWETAQRLGAIVLFHQGSDGRYRFNRYFMGNAIGNLTERAVTFGTLSAGGVLDRFPDLRVLLSHAGGFAAFAANRMDQAAGAFGPDAQFRPDAPPPAGSSGAAGAGRRYTSPFRALPNYEAPAAENPGAYLSRVYYDSCTFSELTLRFVIDAVGIDRVVLGTDYPTPMTLTDAVHWIRGLESLTDAEKEAILSGNAAALGDF
jgi:aminocarboxymuconate-semialdehyde decarboxylase